MFCYSAAGQTLLTRYIVVFCRLRRFLHEQCAANQDRTVTVPCAQANVFNGVHVRFRFSVGIPSCDPFPRSCCRFLARHSGGDYMMPARVDDYHKKIRRKVGQRLEFCGGNVVVLFDELQKAAPGTLDGESRPPAPLQRMQCIQHILTGR